MPKLTLQFEGRVLKEYAVGPLVTIGRLPDNTVVIDNPAVSGHHAHVFCDGDGVILEDLKSTNGTYVNEKHVIRHRLQNGDAILVGKHTLVFDQKGTAKAVVPEAVMSGLDDTMYLDTRQHRSLLATLREERARAAQAAGERPAWVTAAVGVGVLRVVAGDAEQSEYDLSAHTTLIGRSSSALIRLRGWFKPDVAVAIARNGEGYVATAMGGKTLINSQPLSRRHQLKDGDILYVSGLILEFSLKNAGSTRFMSSGQRAATFRALT